MLVSTPSQDPVTRLLSFLEASDRFNYRVDWSGIKSRGRASWDSYRGLWEAGVVPSQDLADAIALFHDLPRATADDLQHQEKLLVGLSPRYLREAWILPFMNGPGMGLAVADPTRTEEISAVRLAVGNDVPISIASFDDLMICFEQQTDLTLSAKAGLAPAPEFRISGQEDLERLQDLASGEPVVHAVDALLDAAVSLSATDIHIEPGRGDVRVRLRIDGLLRMHQNLPASLARAMVSRIKILAGLDIAETRLPQDGRARVRAGEGEADLRVATMPTMHGEAAVIRLLLKEARMLDLSRLGMAPRDLGIFDEQLAEPHGLIVVAGPTGSGKTTTLAAALATLNRPERKIMTIEDPIEYQIPGIHQTQVKPSIDLTFASALRSFLRHDPDVLMVGEMRDKDTATIGIQAALTGHLVLTTLHTNTAVDAVVRLSDLGVEGFLLVSTLRCVVGQRLVRKLCERCRARSPELPPGALALSEKGILKVAPGEEFFTARGCDWCGQTGYRGRIGIFEVLKLDSGLRESLRHRIDMVEIAERANASGMTTMLEDGVAKYRAGMTSIEEVLRATTAYD